MKKILSLVAIAAIALSFAACDDSGVVNPEQETTVDGAFSVGPSTRVFFAKGNLQRLMGSLQTPISPWLFATHQYDTVGNAPMPIATDLFNWNYLESGDSYFKDWKCSDIRNAQGYTWRVLKEEEWLYLFHERRNAERLFGLGSVNGINGLFILPDNYWDKPANVTFTPSTEYPDTEENSPLVWMLYSDPIYTMETSGNGYNHNIFNLDEWALLEKAGVIFLPAAGVVDYYDYPWKVNLSGRYFSCSYVYPDDPNEMIYLCKFEYDQLNPYCELNKTYGKYSVRMVRDVQPEDIPESPVDKAKKEMVEWGSIMMEIQTWLRVQDADESVIQSFNAPMTTVHDVNRDPNATMEQVEAAIKTAKDVCKDYAADYFPVWKNMRLNDLDRLYEHDQRTIVQNIVNEAKDQVNAVVWDNNKNHEQIYDLRVQIDAIYANAVTEIGKTGK